MKTIIICLLIFAGIELISCDPICVYDYKVFNKTGLSVKVHFSSITQKDTSVVLSAGENYIISSAQFVCGGVEDFQANDTMMDVQHIKIFKQDTILSQKNYNLRSSWIFIKQKKYKAEYFLIVCPEDFQ